MNWFLIALIAPFIWSLLNHADKYLISKYFKSGGIGGLFIMSSLFALIPLPFLYWFDSGVFGIGSGQISVLIGSGIMMTIAILLYLLALEKDDPSYVVPFWLLVPVYTYFFGFLILGENLSLQKIIASLVVICGAFVLSLEFEEGMGKFKTSTLFLMIASGILISLSDVLFKGFTITTEAFAPSFFWNLAGTAVVGIFCFLFIPAFRRQFLRVLKSNNASIISLNFGGEVLQTIAMGVNYFATLIAPVTLVLLVGYTFQPLFVFIEGIILTTFFPQILKEKMSKKHLSQKIVSIIIMSAGVYFLL